MDFFLAKTDPDTYSIVRFAQEQKTCWDGVSNPQALRAIRQMKPGDLVFIYHSGREAGICGMAKVISFPREDTRTPKLSVIDLEFVTMLDPPMTLKEIKDSGEFDDWSLVKQARLSTMTAPPKFVAMMRKKYPGKIG
ncbi:MAG: EVE domain-containing protein [Candidatus Solibacter usitatus]|nr:EVE domain-containing protein [Candidatus Solibacter usitatus]